MTNSTSAASENMAFFQFMDWLRERVSSECIDELDADTITPLFGATPASLFEGARVIGRRGDFNRHVDWLLEPEQFRFLEPAQQPMLQIAAAATQLLTRVDDSTYDGLACLKNAAQALDRIWPNAASVGAPKTAVFQIKELFKTPILDHHDGWRDFFEDPTPSLARWYAWDVLMFLHQDEEVDEEVPFQAAHAPVLLVDETRRRGLVALLTIELLQDGGCGFTPIPEALGLTALDADFHAALQRAWQLSGIEGWRGRWSLTKLAPSLDRLDVELLRGRSLEAAVCATIWSALGYVPGTTETAPDPPIRQRRRPADPVDSQPANPVDLKIALTARLGERSGLQPRDKISLEPIKGLSEKLKAAWEADLEAVVVEQDQVPRHDEEWLSAENPRSKPPRRCATIGEAWYEIHASTRHLRAYQSAIVKKWQGEWVDEVDVPETEAGESSR